MIIDLENYKFDLNGYGQAVCSDKALTNGLNCEENQSGKEVVTVDSDGKHEYDIKLDAETTEILPCNNEILSIKDENTTDDDDSCYSSSGNVDVSSKYYLLILYVF